MKNPIYSPIGFQVAALHCGLKAEEQNEWYEIGQAIWKGLAENADLIGKEKKKESLGIPKPYPQTQEKFDTHVRQTAHEYTSKQLKELIQRLHRHNISGVYQDLIEFLKKELNGRGSENTESNK